MFQTDFSTWRMLTKLSTIKAPRALLSFRNRVFFFKLVHSVPLGYWGSSGSVFTNFFFNVCILLRQVFSDVFASMLLHVLHIKCCFSSPTCSHYYENMFSCIWNSKWTHRVLNYGVKPRTFLLQCKCWKLRQLATVIERVPWLFRALATFIHSQTHS